MYFMVGIKSYDFVIAGLIHNMNTETFCNLVMIDLIPWKLSLWSGLLPKL